MPKTSQFNIFLMLMALSFPTFSADTNSCASNLDFTVKSLNENKDVHLCDEYKNKVLLIVNTASKCAFTGQYEGLEALYAKYKDQGLVVLGFPSNDFGKQEPGTAKTIQNFCRTTYGVQFPMFEKSKVRQGNADPLFDHLGKQAGYPKWNFYKYLLNREGKVVDRYSSMTSPQSATLVEAIESLL